MMCAMCSRKIFSRISADLVHLRKSRLAGWTWTCFFSTGPYSRAMEKDASSRSFARTKTEASALKPVDPDRSSSTDLPVFTGERVKQAGKDVFWTGIVIFGVGVTCVMGYAIFHELFSSKSPSGVYSDALKICKKDVRVKSILGEPIRAYGESTRRGRRTHVQSSEYLDGNAHIVQLKFYISGPHASASVYVEKDVTTGTYRGVIFETDDRRERFSLLTPPGQPNLSSIFS